MHSCTQLEVENRSNVEVKTNIQAPIFAASKKLLSDSELAKHVAEYEKLKSNIRVYQNSLKERKDFQEKEKITTAKEYIYKTLTDSIFPYWLGTKWDFNGYTEKPRDGEIACGYFVSTTLRDVGFKLNRFRLAQKAAADIIKDLCRTKNIGRFTTLNQVKGYLDNTDDQDVLIIGLDYHVGFIVKMNGVHYFAHSNFYDEKVVIEPINESKALIHTYNYVIGNLSENNIMIKNWVNR